MHHSFLYISLLSLHDNNVKRPIFTFCGGREHKTTVFFFPNFDTLFKDSNPEELAIICWTEREQREYTQFLNDVFVAVAIVVGGY